MPARTVDLVINSHGHGDHIHGNRAFTRAKVAIHRLEVDTIISKEAFADGLVGSWADLMSVPLNFNVDFDYPETGLTFKDTQIIPFLNHGLILPSMKETSLILAKLN